MFDPLHPLNTIVYHSFPDHFYLVQISLRDTHSLNKWERVVERNKGEFSTTEGGGGQKRSIFH